MNIVFVNPSLSHQELYSEWDLSDVKSYSTPLGILSLSSVARKKGYNVNLIDAQALALSIEQTIENIISLNPDIVALTAMTISMYRAGEIASLVKNISPKIKIIVGGPHITALPEDTMELFPAIDIGVLGEGEETFAELSEVLNRESGYYDIKGLIVRLGDKLINNGPREFIKNLDILPLPSFDLIPDIKSHYRLSIFGTMQSKSMGLVTSRGCPGQCIFCDTGVFGHKFRYYSAEYVTDMIGYLYSRYDIKDFLFYDDLFVGNRKRLLQICELLKKRNIKITWSCCARVDFVTPEILAVMKDNGCWMIEYGIESGSQKILDFLKKGIEIEQIRKAIKCTKKAGIKSKGNFIFGNPLETKETLRESIELAVNLKLDYFQHTFLAPLPGSELYEIADNYGNFDKDWRNTNTFKINYIPYGLTREELKYFSKLAWRRFYLRPIIIWQEIRKLKNPVAVLRFISAIKAFLKSALFRK